MRPDGLAAGAKRPHAQTMKPGTRQRKMLPLHMLSRVFLFSGARIMIRDWAEGPDISFSGWAGKDFIHTAGAKVSNRSDGF